MPLWIILTFLLLSSASVCKQFLSFELALSFFTPAVALHIQCGVPHPQASPGLYVDMLSTQDSTSTQRPFAHWLAGKMDPGGRRTVLVCHRWRGPRLPLFSKRLSPPLSVCSTAKTMLPTLSPNRETFPLLAVLLLSPGVPANFLRLTPLICVIFNRL